MTEHSSHAELCLPRRQPKAEKIHQLLRPHLSGARHVRLLEVGTGSGAIAHHFATVGGERIAVSAVDVDDQRQVRGGYDFQTYDGIHLPFADGIFDIVISNHVIEHVGGRARQRQHICELARVVAPDGIIYLAAPSRWQFVEPHFRLAALSWLPRRWRDGYVRLLGRGERYDCDPLSHRELESMFAQTCLKHRNMNAAALRIMLSIEGDQRPLGMLLARLPETWLQRGYRFSPTMVYLAGKTRMAGG